MFTAFAALGLFVTSLVVCVFGSIIVLDKLISADEGLGVVWLGGWVGTVLAIAVTVLTVWLVW